MTTATEPDDSDELPPVRNSEEAEAEQDEIVEIAKDALDE